MAANTPPVPGTRFTVDWLNDLATCGDVAADKVIEGLAKRRSTTDVERQNGVPRPHAPDLGGRRPPRQRRSGTS